MSAMDVNEILGILPHRYPFMLVDRIVEIDVEAKSIVGYKNLTFNEPFFQGHFPGEPIMPGVMQLEAMAQVAGIMLNKLSQKEGEIAYFMSIDKAKFRRKVVPGDTLRMEIKVTRMRSRMAAVEAKAFVGDDLASQAELMFGYGAG
jgi:3-hydroxyacyl-[acyl-carrier-protein] dehydratase